MLKRNLKLAQMKSNIGQMMPMISRRTKLAAKMEEVDLTGGESSNNSSAHDKESEHRYSGVSPGETNKFLDRYTLGEKLGEGCNGLVYRCVCQANHRVYAVKKMHVEEEELLLLKKSFIHMKSLQHESIVKYQALYF